MKYFFTLILTLSFLTVLLFRDIPRLFFFSDDFIWLLDAKQDGVDKVPRYFVDAEGFFYRPVTKIYFWVMWRLVGDAAFWYHVVNLAVHFIISLLIYVLTYCLVKRVLPTRAPDYALPLIALASSVLFFVHPAHLESIVWVSVITELIPALCVIAGLLCVVRMVVSGKSWWAVPVLGLFLVGLGGHEYMVVFPAIVYITHLYLFFTERRHKKFVLQDLVAPFKNYPTLYVFLVAFEILYFIMRWVANSHWSGGDYSYDLSRLPFNFVGNLLGYLGLLAVGIPFVDWYFQLRFFFREQLLMAIGLLAVSLIAIGVIGRAMWRYRKSGNFYLLLYCVAFFVIALLPFLGLGGLAERYLYLPSFSLLMFLAYGVFLLAMRIEKFTESVADFTAFGLILGMVALYWMFSITADQANWRLASQAVESRLDEFKYDCEFFQEGETIERSSPQNRIGRAWYFQVGYEEGANLYCDKNLRILRK